MKRLLLLCIAVTVCATGSAWAAGGGGTGIPDAIGIYVDTEAKTDCVVDLPIGIYHFYVVLTDLTSDGIRGIEFKMVPEGDLSVYFNPTFPTADFINVGTRTYEFIVGFGSPLMATDGLLVAMEFDAYLSAFEVDGGRMYLYPTYFASYEGFPCYLDAYDTDIIKPLTPSSGDSAEPVLSVNDGHCGPVPTQAASWDGVKSLYR